MCGAIRVVNIWSIPPDDDATVYACHGDNVVAFTFWGSSTSGDHSLRRKGVLHYSIPRKLGKSYIPHGRGGKSPEQAAC